MKLNFLPVVSKNRRGLQKGRRLTEHEIVKYQREKIIRDNLFFESAAPYMTGFTIGMVGIIFTLGIFNKYYERKHGQSFSRKFYLNLLDIEEQQIKS